MRGTGLCKTSVWEDGANIRPILHFPQVAFRPGSIRFDKGPAVSVSNKSTVSLAVSLNTKRRGARVNASGYVGVSVVKSMSRWQAIVTLSNGKRKLVGRASTAAAAAALRTAFIAEHGVADPRTVAADIAIAAFDAVRATSPLFNGEFA